MVNQILSSVVSLELNADQIRYLVNRSPGKIVSAVVPTFEAVSRNGNMAVTVQNNGTLVADYTLTVSVSPPYQTLCPVGRRFTGVCNGPTDHPRNENSKNQS